MCDYISKKDLQYIVGKAVEWFDANEEESIDWRLARKAVKGESRQGEKDRVKGYILRRINIEYMYGNIQNYDVEKDILLFLISWNIQKFKYEKRDKIKKWLEAIRNIKNYIEGEGKNKSYEEIFRCVLNEYKHKIGKEEKVITAKTLLVMNPDKFVAWDNKIIEIFFIFFRKLNLSIEKKYDLFNKAIDRFLRSLSECEYDLQKYLNERYKKDYEYSNKKLLDMILYIYANGKIIDDSRFICNACKIVCAIITHLNNLLNNLNNCV